MLGLFSGSTRCNRLTTVLSAVFPIGRDHGEFIVSSVFVVSGCNKLTSVSSAAKDRTAFLTASLAAIIKVSSSVIITLSVIVSLAIFASSMHRICMPSVAVGSFR